MPASAPSLLELQRELFAALRTPLTGDNRARNQLPRGAPALPAAFVAAAEAHLLPSATLTAVQRLELYQRQYWFRLLDSLADDFPALRWLLGARAFAALAEHYLREVPPGRANLRHLGAGLAELIGSGRHRLAHAVAAQELARLESAWIAAFEAAELPMPAPELLATTPLALQPHVTLLALRTPAETYWSHALEERPRGRVRPPAPAPTRFVAVLRVELSREVVRLHPAAFALLSALVEHGSLERALDEAAPLLPARRGAALLQDWFRRWTAERWLAAR